MKIYFSGSIRGGRQDVELYNQIITKLSEHGTVLTTYIGDKNLPPSGQVGFTDSEIFERDLAWIKEADVLVAEVTTPSLGVGFEIAKADEWGKKVLCLYRELPDKRISAMISGCPRLMLDKYGVPKDLDPILKNFFNQ